MMIIMASGINIYSQLLISTIVDINNCEYMLIPLATEYLVTS